jgi:uncharacterized membrane protein
LSERSQRTAITRRAVLASLVLLVAAQALDSWVRQAPPVIWALRILPLLVFLPGLIRDRVRTHIWLCFVILLYFLTVVLRLFYNPADPVAWVAMASIVTCFVAAMLYARWRSQELRGEVTEVDDD